MEVTLPISSIVIIVVGSLGVATAILIAIVFLFQKRKPNISDVYLSMLLLFSGLTLLNETFTVSGIANRFKDLYFIPIYYALSIAPLFYLFVKSKSRGSIPYWDYAHLLLPVVQAGIYWSIGFRSIEFKSGLWESSTFRHFLALESLLFPVGLIVYSLLSRSILSRASDQKYFWSDDLRNWLINFTRVFIFIASLELIMFLAEYFLSHRFGPGINIFRLMVFSSFIFWIAYNTIRQLFSSTIYTSRPKSTDIPFASEEFQLIKDEMVRLMEEDKVYLNADLSVQILANYLGINEKKCSQVLSKGMKTNFNQFINSYRIEAFKEKLRTGRHQELTLLSLAFECGFDSKSTFNRSFKQQTGFTPSEYIKSLHSTGK